MFGFKCSDPEHKIHTIQIAQSEKVPYIWLHLCGRFQDKWISAIFLSSRIDAIGWSQQDCPKKTGKCVVVCEFVWERMSVYNVHDSGKKVFNSESWIKNGFYMQKHIYILFGWQTLLDGFNTFMLTMWIELSTERWNGQAIGMQNSEHFHSP